MIIVSPFLYKTESAVHSLKSQVLPGSGSAAFSIVLRARRFDIMLFRKPGISFGDTLDK
jgi:hypothetical protein